MPAELVSKDVIWQGGDPQPIRPAKGCSDYARELERYADALEEILIWLARDYARLPNEIAAALQGTLPGGVVHTGGAE